MAGTKRVERGLAPLCEARQPALLAQGLYTVAATGQDLVRIGLVADIPDQPVIRGLENVMQGNRQLHNAKPGTEMATGLRNGINGRRPQFGGKTLQFALGETPKLFNGGDAVKQGGCCHSPSGPPSRTSLSNSSLLDIRSIMTAVQ